MTPADYQPRQHPRTLTVAVGEAARGAGVAQISFSPARHVDTGNA